MEIFTSTEVIVNYSMCGLFIQNIPLNILFEKRNNLTLIGPIFLKWY